MMYSDELLLGPYASRTIDLVTELFDLPMK